MHVSSPFENDTPFAGSALEQGATHPGKWQQSLLSLPEAIDLPRIVARDLTQHSPLIAETLSLRHLSQPIGDEQKDILTGNAPDAPLVQPDDATDLISDRTSKQENNNQSEQRKAIKATLAEAIASIKAQLKPFADDPLLTAKLREAFGDRWNIEKAQAILERLSSDDHSKFPDIRLKFFSSEQLEAQSAFAASTNTVYLFENFLSEHLDSPETIATVLLEEVGHYIDAQLNVLDSPGDEGAIFAAIVQNHQLSQEDWQALKAENDFALLLDNGKPTIVEQANLYGTAGNDYLVGTTANDEIYGAAGNDTLSGGAGNDYLYGDTEDDVLDGGTGNDTMRGGAGNDIYYVDSAGDYVEEVGGGIDTVASYVLFSLTDTNTQQVENLFLLGSVVKQATGNALNNNLQGNHLDNALNGGAGNDTLTGNAGNDTLDGGTGADSMTGGTGNDVYFVDSTGDKVVERADVNEGIDTVAAYINFSLNATTGTQWVESLSLLGSVATEGTGNDLSNNLQGNHLDNIFRGEGGHDTLIGNAGNDQLYGGFGADVLNGNTGDDVLVGDAGNDILVAESGADRLLGGSGADRFVLSKSNSTFVTIQDFSATENDAIHIGQDSTTISLKASQFSAGTGVRSATTLSQRVLYDTTTDELFYDADGSGSQFDPVHIATLTNKAALNAANLYVTPTPAIAIELQQDTGNSTTDRLTSNTTIKGNFTMPGTGVQLSASFDGTTFVPVTANTIDADGNFTLTPARLAQINGGSLPDGNYTLYLKATDGGGAVSNVATLSFTLDTVAPTLSGFKLAPQFEVSSISGIQTVHKSVTLTGQTTPNSIVTLQTGATTTADANGVFEFQNVALTLGTNTFTAEVIDAAGNKTAVNLSVERIEPFIDGGLKLDTGKSNVDGKTSDSTITGQFTLPGQLAELLGSFDGSSFVKLSPTLNADGSFTLDRAQLAQLKGGTLTDGAYTLSLKAKDTLGNFSTVKTVVFDLDTAAPELEIQELIDGIRWKEGEKLKGTLKNLALESGTVVFYQFDGQGAIQQLQLNAEGGFEKLLNIPDNAGSHTLKVFSVDDAGNQKAVDFSFLVKGTRPIVDDDEFVSDDPTNPPPTSPSDPYWSDGNTAGSWFNGSGTGTGGSGGSGMWGYGVSPGNSPAVIPSGANPNGDPNAPENKPLTYLEKVSIILDQAMQSISTSPETVTKKAALKNRLSLLMEVADLVDEQRLYDRMRLTFYGIYDEADDLITNRQQAYARGTELAAEIIADPDAMKLETFQATLVGVVNQVFAQQGYTVGSTAKEESLVNALLELAETYASLNPTRATDNASTPDFLDSLWRVQQTINPRTPLSLETIRAELERGVGALDNLLDGVQNKAQALKFVNNLLLAASETASLDGEAIYDAQFLRELVAFGFEYAKLNPNDLANATENGTEAFLGTFWQNTVKDSTAMRQATGKLDDLFARLETKEERLKLLKFETNLLKAIGLSGQELLEEKQDAQFLSAIVGLGGAYAALNPIANSAEPIDFFLDTLWNAQNEAGLQKGIGELSSFVQDFDDSTQIIRYQQKLLTTFKLVPDFQQIEYNPAFIKDFFKLSSYHAFLQVDKTSDVSDSLLSKVWEAKNEEDLRLVANNFQKMFAQVIDGNYIANNSSTNIATILHQEIIEQAQQTIPDAGVQEWNIWRAGATRLGITDIYEFKTQWVYGYRNVINYAASLFNIPATLLAGVIHMEVGGDPQVQDDIVHGLRGVIPDGFGGSLGIPESQTSFGNLSVQIETAARVLGYVSVQDLSQNRLEELISRQQILLILESLKDPRMNILIGAAYLSDLRDKYAPGEPAQQLTENDLIVIGSAYNYGEYEYDEDTLSITQNPINYDFLLNRWNYGRDALQRVEQYQLDRVLVGDYPDE